MSKKNNKFIKPNQGEASSPLQVLLMPISILLAGVIVAVSFLIGSTAIISNMKTTVEASVKKALEGIGNIGTGTTGGVQEPDITITSEQIASLFDAGNITFGDKNSKVVFVEFSDPSCPYCHAAGGHNPELNMQMGSQFIMTANGGSYVPPVIEMKKLVDEGKAAFVWLYNNGHGNGELATQALYCAHEKGQFWPAHDKLMTSEGYTLINDIVKNDKAKLPQLLSFLEGIVDTNSIKSCMESGKYDTRPAKDQTIASSFGSSGTPGFFINTTGYSGAYSYTDMKSVVDAALQS